MLQFMRGWPTISTEMPILDGAGCH